MTITATDAVVHEAQMAKLPKRIRPDDRFRRDAVRRAKSSTEPIAVTAEKLGMGKSTLYRWIARYPDEQQPFHHADGSAAVGSQQEPPVAEEKTASRLADEGELEVLRREVIFLRDENEILRRAALAFARASYPNPDR